MKDSISEPMKNSDVSYEPPAIEVLGDLLEITQGTGVANNNDNRGASI